MNDSSSHFFKKSFGQNFLRDVSYAKKIVEAACIDKSDTVIEIGPGDGIVTKYLLESAKQVISIEIDNELIPVLNEKFQTHNSFKLINEDILSIDLSSVHNNKPYKVVGSLPYNISKKIIQFIFRDRIQT